ncbi:ATP-binding protein [Bradyrhizobium sp. 17]|uniref:ATP-binding protein n=1 Tax=Bradyrhizobium sp. 17 TaxID=2782649 RepID=UPI0023EE566F|nr:ATP-binding protein [Bradyrhizobium sp. 17]
MARTCCCLGHLAFGKTHLAFALGREAILAGHSVQFVATTTVVAQLPKRHSEAASRSDWRNLPSKASDHR